MLKERFKLKSAVYLIPIKEGKVLLSRRFNTGWMDGKYSLIAGHLDGGETVSDAMVREAFEEANIKIIKKDLIPIKVIHRMSDAGSGEYVDFFFVVEKWIGNPKIMETNKCDDLSWFPIEKLPKNTLAYVKKVIETRNDNTPFFEFGWD
jgi:8-oxo-dGTP pyrophosphatase MutT (NUDIX family)